MCSSEEANWLLSVKRAKQGETPFWEKGDLTLPQVPGTAQKHHVQILPGLGAGLYSSLHKSLRRKIKTDRHFFSLIMRTNNTQEAFQTFLQYCLSFKSGQREMNAEDSGSATKKDVSLSKSTIKKTL